MGKTKLRFHSLCMQTLSQFLEPIEATNPDPEESDAEGAGKAHTKVINQHIPSGFCVNSKFAHGRVENPLKL